MHFCNKMCILIWGYSPNSNPKYEHKVAWKVVFITNFVQFCNKIVEVYCSFQALFKWHVQLEGLLSNRIESPSGKWK